MFTAMQAVRFMFAGNARLTFVSQKTGTRFTYRIRVKESNGSAVYFVSVLTGSSNESDYTFIGTIFDRKTFVHSRRSSIGATAPSVVAFSWAFRFLGAGLMPAGCTLHHEGRCGKCAKPLTVPESIESGLGPICAAS